MSEQISVEESKQNGQMKEQSKWISEWMIEWSSMSRFLVVPNHRALDVDLPGSGFISKPHFLRPD